EKVLHAPDAVHRAGLLDQLADQVRPLDLATEVDDAVLDVDVHGLLRRVGGPEDLALHPLGERLIVRRRLLRRGPALRGLDLPLYLVGPVLRLATGPIGTAPEERERAV